MENKVNRYDVKVLLKKKKEEKVAIIALSVILLITVIFFIFAYFAKDESKKEIEHKYVYRLEDLYRLNYSYKVESKENDIRKVIDEEEKSEDITYIEFKATAYCPCEKCCGEWALNRPNGIVYGASGKELISGYSVGVDTSLYEYGTIFEDENGKRYEAMDTGSIISGNHIDVYKETHDEAVEFGLQKIKLKVIN